MNRRFLYVRNGHAWLILDNGETPARTVALVFDANPETKRNEDAEHLVRLLNDEDDIRRQMGEVGNRMEGA